MGLFDLAPIIQIFPEFFLGFLHISDRNEVQSKFDCNTKFFRLRGTCLDTWILKIGSPSQKLHLDPKIRSYVWGQGSTF